MKKIYVLFSIVFGFTNLTAQKIVSGEFSSQTETQSYNSSLGDCDTIFSFITIDNKPVGLTYDGNSLYSYGFFSDLIYRFSLDGQLLGSIPSPSLYNGGGDLDFDGTFLWAVIEQDAKIYKIDPANGETIDSFTLPTSDSIDPNTFGCAYDNGYIWITEYIDKTLMRIDAATGYVIDSFAINRRVLPIKIINDNLYGIEYIDDTLTGRVQLVIFDRETGSVIDSLPWCLSYPLGLCWAGNHLWGLSSHTTSGFGEKRIYEFDSLITSMDRTVPLGNSFSVFPNPATTKISIKSLTKIEKIEIFNLKGKKVLVINDFEQNFSSEINITNFQKGIYFVKIFRIDGAYTDKIVIQ